MNNPLIVFSHFLKRCPNSKNLKLQTLYRIELYDVFWGVYRFAQIPAVQGDVGWVPGSVQPTCEMIRLWNRLIKMSEDRINKKVFMWSKLYSSPVRGGGYAVYVQE